MPKCCIDVVHVVDLWILVVVVADVAVVILGEICLTASSLNMRYNMHAAFSFIVDVFVKCLTSIFVCIGYCRPTNLATLTTWIPNVSTKCISIHHVNLVLGIQKVPPQCSLRLLPGLSSWGYGGDIKVAKNRNFSAQDVFFGVSVKSTPFSIAQINSVGRYFGPPSNVFFHQKKKSLCCFFDVILELSR